MLLVLINFKVKTALDKVLKIFYEIKLSQNNKKNFPK